MILLLLVGAAYPLWFEDVIKQFICSVVDNIETLRNGELEVPWLMQTLPLHILISHLDVVKWNLIVKLVKYILVFLYPMKHVKC